MKKKILSFFLSLALIFVAIPFSNIHVIGYDIPDCPNCGGDTYQGLQTYPCTTGGYATFICSICEYSFEMEVPPREHNYEVIDYLDATCDEDGYIEYCCHDCNDSYTENSPATGHSLGMEQTIYSCTSGGYVYATCSICQMDIVLRTIPAYGHSYNETVIQKATCYSTGISEFWCSGCDHSYTKTTPKLPHVMDRWYYENPTCTERGYKIRYCMNAGMCDYFEDALIPATGHSFSQWVTEKEATCLENGKKVRTCANCGKTEESIIVATGSHNFGEWTTETEATCIKSGLKSATCLNCGENITEEIEPLGHSFDDWVIKAFPSNTESGEKERTCLVCNHTETILIEPGKYTLGDTSGDGVVDVNDYNLIVEIANGTRTPTAEELYAADINQDGTVDGFDAIYFDLILNNYI